ncbi:MAG: metal-sulfur cluster assembly factor [Microthrixaceae bacterium]
MTHLPTESEVMEHLRNVIDPELGMDIVELGMAKGATVEPDGLVRVTVALTTSGCPLRAQIQRDVRSRIEGLPGVTKVKIDWSELNQEEKRVAMERARKRIAERPDESGLVSDDQG